MDQRKRAARVVLATAVSLSTGTALAQSQGSSDTLEEVVVTGIRASLQQSLDQKRQATTVVEVVSAEDIGKLPDKNVADALQRVPGVNIASAAGGEGGFDENDRVSLRGTSPSLTQTLVNGHSVASGDWFVLDQIGTVGRSVSYALLPSEIVSKVVVQKSATADIVEGGTAGAVDIQTRRALQMPKQFGVEALAQAFYADLPSKTDPQANVMLNWKNPDSTFGALAQVFFEKRHSRRDGQEFFGYTAIAPTDAIALANPSVAGVFYPQGVNSALFEQTRERKGGALDFEWKPVDSLTLDFNGFYSHLDASNYNRSFYSTPQNLIQGSPYARPVDACETQGLVPTSYTVRNNTLVSATFPNSGLLKPCPVTAGEVDSLYRPGSASETYYADFNVSYAATDRLTLSGKAGYTHGLGLTSPQWFYGAFLVNTGTSYALHGVNAPASLSFQDFDPAKVDPDHVIPGFAADTYIRAIDQETYVQADGLLKIDQGVVESVKFGLRYSNHNRAAEYPESGSNQTPLTTAPPYGGGQYPNNFGNGLSPGAGFLSQVFQYDPGAITNYVNGNILHGPRTEGWQQEYHVREQTAALYGMTDLNSGPWHANAGVRFVQTRLQTSQNIAGGPNPIGLDNIIGPFTPTEIDHTYYDVLPSVSFKYDIRSDLVARAAASRTVTRPDYSALAGAVNLDNTFLTGSGGNPNLNPIRSNNFEGSLEWYFQPRSLVSIGAFYMDMRSYVDYTVVNAQYFNTQLQPPGLSTYKITQPINLPAHNAGVEFSYQQALPLGFGFVGNFTYADGHTRAGTELVGSSKTTYNLQGYYENSVFSARLAYTYRSAYLVGLNSSFIQHEDNVGSLDASLNYKISDHFTATVDVLNLTNEVLKYYGQSRDQPLALYSNGRQYFAGVRFSL